MDVLALYKDLINRTMQETLEDFANAGLSEDVRQEFHMSWQKKLQEKWGKSERSVAPHIPLRSTPKQKANTTIGDRPLTDKETPKVDDEEDVDDNLSDVSVDEINEITCTNTVVCFFESSKTKRVKDKLKVTLSDGVVNCDGKDYLFKSATGEFKWES